MLTSWALKFHVHAQARENFPEDTVHPKEDKHVHDFRMTNGGRHSVASSQVAPLLDISYAMHSAVTAVLLNAAFPQSAQIILLLCTNLRLCLADWMTSYTNHSLSCFSRKTCISKLRARTRDSLQGCCLTSRQCLDAHSC